MAEIINLGNVLNERHAKRKLRKEDLPALQENYTYYRTVAKTYHKVSGETYAPSSEGCDVKLYFPIGTSFKQKDVPTLTFGKYAHVIFNSRLITSVMIDLVDSGYYYPLSEEENVYLSPEEFFRIVDEAVEVMRQKRLLSLCGLEDEDEDDEEDEEDEEDDEDNEDDLDYEEVDAYEDEEDEDDVILLEDLLDMDK